MPSVFTNFSLLILLILTFLAKMLVHMYMYLDVPRRVVTEMSCDKDNFSLPILVSELVLQRLFVAFETRYLTKYLPAAYEALLRKYDVFVQKKLRIVSFFSKILFKFISCLGRCALS